MTAPNRMLLLAGAALTALAAACGGEETRTEALGGAAPPPEGRPVVVVETTVTAVLPAAGVAEPVQRALISTKLMGAVTAVPVQEGDRVRAGQVLARIDARDVEAKRAQVEAARAEARAVRDDAATNAARFRSLYADSAATRAQLDQVETGLARAEAAVRTADAAAAEVAAMSSYATLRAPFAGVVVQRHVDPGAFVAPGAPIVALEDATRLRIGATAAPEAARGLARGDTVAARVEGRPARAVVEGVVPLPGALYQVNALVDNRTGEFPAGGAATLEIPLGTRTALLVPEAALVREGELTGVRVLDGRAAGLRWVRLGPARDGWVEVLAGLRAGDRVLVPSAAEGAR